MSLLSFLFQSKKNYEVKCKEADDVEQGAEKTNAAAKNPEKVCMQKKTRLLKLSGIFLVPFWWLHLNKSL